jgi:ATP-dependent Lon protease
MIKNRTLHFLKVSDIAPEEFYNFVRNLSLIPASVNFIAMNLPLDLPTKQQLLEAPGEQHRAVALLKIINTLIQLQEIKQSIENKTRAELDQQQKEYFLNQQIKNLQAELGGADETSSKQDDINKMRKEAEGKMWSDKVQEIFHKELMRLQRINIQSPDYNVQLNYLQTMLQLPWDYCTVDHLKLKSAEKILNQDHYGMEKVKERILEHLAVLQLRGDQKSPIICLYGPPGVGKTSLGKSIAKALKRKYVRMSLGGMHDESEIRGHRRTYIGAMPGRIVKNLIKAGSSNPVFVLDEIDKVSQATHNGDPSSALLEVLDPEQNTAFHDNFLDIDYDLSRVMFIATANDINTIPRPLLDRMELIEVGGYITEEKIEIAKRHLVPKEKEKNGLESFKDLKLNKSAIEYIIEHYTRESGVRSLEKQINKVFRKMALEMARTEEEPQMTVTTEMVKQMLGKPLFNRDK